MEVHFAGADPSTLFRTDELHRRPPRKADYLRETLALQDLARQLADSPRKVLPRLVELAMDYCDATSGGISLYEPQPGSPGVFRWHHLCGEMARFSGATTPRDYSPCGAVLDDKSPQLVAHPERGYSWVAEAGVILPEVLLVPLYSGLADAVGTLWVVAKEEGAFDSEDARMLADLAAFAGVALKVARDEDQLSEALQLQETLTREMSHRVNNLFSLAAGLVRNAARAVGGKEEMVADLTAKLDALARSHALIRRSFANSEKPEGTSLKRLLTSVLEPYRLPYQPSRFQLSGQDVEISESAVTALALALHEAATNAVKYGGLKDDAGTLHVEWNIDGANIDIVWTERSSTSVEEPRTTGFGTTLMRRAIEGQLGGTIERDWTPEGLSLRLSLPRDRL